MWIESKNECTRSQIESKNSESNQVGNINSNQVRNEETNWIGIDNQLETGDVNDSDCVR